jgi:uncharacterized protein (TIGR02118 family)
MAVTLMALYRKPDGGDEAIETFRQRYSAEHLPLIRRTPGLLSLDVQRVAETFSDSDLFLVTRMEFEDRAALERGLQSDAMRDAGRNLREIAPGLSTLLLLEPDLELNAPLVSAADADTDE